MLKRRNIVLVVLAFATGTVAWGRGDNAQPRPPAVTLGAEEVKQLILLMDQDKNGKISKKEFLKFMEAEFSRLDKDKSGEMDVQELKNSQVRVVNFSSAGK